MKVLPPSIQQLIRAFNMLPGIGAKTSERFVYYLLRQPAAEIEALSQSLQTVKANIRLCKECATYTEQELCALCADPQRDRTLLCVVAEPKDVMAIEQTGEFTGVYHVLGGVIDHAAGVGPEQLRMQALVDRIDRNGITELIIATNPDMEGEATALTIASLLKGKTVLLTRIARGLPVGADIEFADEVTLANAMTGRQRFQSSE